MNTGNYPINSESEHQEKVAKSILIACCLLYAAHATYAAITQRHLYGDASWFLLHIVSDSSVTHFYGNFHKEFYYSRVTAYWMTQLPTVIALRLGVSSIQILSYVLGITYFAHKILSLIICYMLLENGKKRFIAFPLLGLLAGSINSDVYIVTEIHIASSFLWPIAIILTRSDRLKVSLLCSTILATILASFTYESWAFFSPLLICAAIYQLKDATGYKRGQLILTAICLSVPALINWAAILFPRDPANKSGFVHGTLNILGDFFRGSSYWHIGALVSLIAFTAVISVMLFGAYPKNARIHRIFWIAICLALALIPPVHYLRNATHLDLTYSIADRGFAGLVMQLGILLIYLCACMFPHFFSARKSATIAPLILALALGQVTWQILVTHAWANATDAARTTLAMETGPVSCTDVDKYRTPRDHVPPSNTLCHWWVTPLSALLSSQGKVRALLISQEQFKAFDPLNRNTLPADGTSSIDYSIYKEAINRSLDIYAGDSLSFTAGQSPTLMLSDGFSSSETWGTWSIGKISRVHLCAPEISREGTLQLTFMVSPFMKEQGRTLDVSIRTAAGATTNWAFNSSDAFVERSMTLNAADLSADGCGDITVELPSYPRSPLELGLSSDPRHLGIAFVGLKVRKY